MEKDLHLQINELLDNDLNADRIKKLEAKQKPKTKVQRLRGVYWLLLLFGGLSQLLGVVLASTGVMYYLSTKLSSNGFFLAVTAAVLLLGLEVAKHIVLKGYHSQRLDDKHVSPITYSLIAFLLLINSFFAYVGTPHAIEYFTEKPTLVSLDSVAAKEDVVLAANIATIQSEIAKHDTTANKIFTSASWLQKLSNKDRPAYQTALNAKAQAEKMVTAVKLQAATSKALALKEAEKENKSRINDYFAWCMSFGTWLALVSLAFDIIFFFAFWFCENYTRLEVKEYNAILALRENVQSSTQSNTPSIPHLHPTKVKGRRRTQSTINTTPLTTPTPQRSMQIITGQKVELEAKEGDIVKEEGKRDRVLVEVKDKGLIAKTSGELKTLISAQTTEHRKEHLLNLLKKLEQ